MNPRSFASIALCALGSAATSVACNGNIDIALGTEAPDANADAAAPSVPPRNGDAGPFDSSATGDGGHAYLGDDIGVGSTHSCSLRAGQVLCAGRNFYGQIGTGTPISPTNYTVPAPVLVPGAPVAKLFVGGIQTCAINGSGQLYCWGGPAVPAPRVPTIVTLPGSGAVSEVSLGEAHTCAVARGELFCWGKNERGQLADASLAAGPTPTKITIAGASAIAHVSAGSDGTCAVDTSGALFCWGGVRRDAGGTVLSLAPATPTRVTLPGDEAVLAVSSGVADTCALTVATRSVYCWRSSAARSAPAEDVTAPALVAMPAGVVVDDIARAAVHACARSTAGEIYCWGRNVEGELGLPVGDTADRALVRPPTRIALPAGESVTRMAASSSASHTCVLAASGNTYCWGYNFYGQLAVGKATPSELVSKSQL